MRPSLVAYSKLFPFVSGSWVAIRLATRNEAAHRKNAQFNPFMSPMRPIM
jgi:hypothetical protein